MFLIGAVAAFMCVFLQMRLKEPEKWVKARDAGRLTGAKFGSYASLFGEARWRRPALLGMLLCVAGVVGLWGVGFFMPELAGDVVGKIFKAPHFAPEQIPCKRLMLNRITMIAPKNGSFLGILFFTKLA